MTAPAPHVERRPTTWHVLTPELPPTTGGVADYVALLAPALARAAGPVRVWCPAVDPASVSAALDADALVTVRRVPGLFEREGRALLGRALDRSPRPRVLLVEYVPHGFGRRGMNVAFAAWALSRRRRGDDVRVMFHEVAYPWVRRRPTTNVLAVAQRIMARLLLRAASRVYVSTPAWIPLLRRLGGRGRAIVWTPIPSTIPAPEPTTAVSAADVAADVRRDLGLPASAPLLGHFGTYGRAIVPTLRAALDAVLDARPDVRVLLLGAGGQGARAAWVAARPERASQVVAPGWTDATTLARRLRACDAVVQPFPDGVSARRSSVMASLALGVPVVTNSGPATEPCWRDAVHLVDGPMGARAAGVVALLDDPARRRALGERGRRLHDARFALRHTIATLLEPVSGGTNDG